LILTAKANGLTSTLTGDLVEGGLRIVDVNGDKVLILKIVLFLGNPYPDFTGLY
jgi:hypothetical protein